MFEVVAELPLDSTPSNVNTLAVPELAYCPFHFFFLCGSHEEKRDR
jgi:hypothetical protein